MEIVARLHEVLNMIKGFSAGYSTKMRETVIC